MGRIALTSSLNVTVEFYGVVRSRAGVSHCSLRVAAEQGTLGGLFRELRHQFPELSRTCFDEQGLKPEFLASIGGDRFVRDLQTPLRDGDVVLLLVADGGG